jgi:hypothetical protein
MDVGKSVNRVLVKHLGEEGGVSKAVTVGKSGDVVRQALGVGSWALSVSRCYESRQGSLEKKIRRPTCVHSAGLCL